MQKHERGGGVLKSLFNKKLVLICDSVSETMFQVIWMSMPYGNVKINVIFEPLGAETDIHQETIDYFILLYNYCPVGMLVWRITA